MLPQSKASIMNKILYFRLSLSFLILYEIYSLPENIDVYTMHIFAVLEFLLKNA